MCGGYSKNSCVASSVSATSCHHKFVSFYPRGSSPLLLHTFVGIILRTSFVIRLTGGSITHQSSASKMGISGFLSAQYQFVVLDENLYTKTCYRVATNKPAVGSLPYHAVGSLRPYDEESFCC